MNRITRRKFLKDQAALGHAAAIAAGTFAAASPTKVLGANETVRFALIGCGGRGRSVAANLIREGGRCVALCDVDDSSAASASDFFEQRAGGGSLPRYKYPEQVFDRQEVDAVVLALPVHWHAPLTIQACQAGKDVFVEKPHTHNIWESWQVIAAARKYERVVQVGTQNRSAEYNQEARRVIQEGHLGPTHLVKVYNLLGGGPWRLGEPEDPPASLDWDRWLGPAAERPYRRSLYRRGYWRLWDLGGGSHLSDGIHQMDLAHMLLGDPGLPQSVVATGGRLAHPDDDSQTPDVLACHFEYDDFVLVFEASEYPAYMRKTPGQVRQGDEFPLWMQNSTRVELYGRDLMMLVGRMGGGWQMTAYPWEVKKQMYGRHPDPEHARNFLECVKSRRSPNADPVSQHASISVLHMANIAHRLGNRKLHWDDQAGQFDDAEANQLIKRQYRSPYVVPEQV